MARARQLVEGPRGLLRHPKRFNASRPQPQPARRTDQGGGVKTGQHLAPRRVRGIQVAIGQPGYKAAIWDRRRQLLPVIAGKYFLQQDRHRPAIEHDVVISEHKPDPIWCGADQRHPEGRRVGEVADRGAFFGAQPLDLLIDIDIDIAVGVQFDIAPRRHGISRDELHRLVELLRRIGQPGWDGG